MTLLLVGAGEKFNLLEDDVVTSSPAASSVYPLSALYDGRPSQVFRFGSIGTDCYVQRDGNRVSNGGFETSTLSGWVDASSGAGFSTSEETTIVNSGAKALKMTTAAVSGVAQRYWDIPNVRSGARWNWSVALRGDGTRTARLRVQNLQTGKYWTGSAWSSTPTDLATRATATYATSSGAFTLETFDPDNNRPALVTLRIYLLANEASVGAAYADDCYLWPSWDFVSVHGHRFTEGLTCELRSSTDGFGASDALQASPTIAQPTFYKRLGAPVDDRYARLKLVGTPLSAIELGEVVFGQILALQRNQKQGWELREMEADVFNESSAGDSYDYVLTYHPRRALGLQFAFSSATPGTPPASYKEARNEVWRRSRGRMTPLVIVPDDSSPEVLLAKISREWKVLRILKDHYSENDLTAAELPFAGV